MHTGLLLDMAADAASERIAVGSRQNGLSFAALKERAKGGAAWLSTQAGDTIVYIGLNGPTLPVALFASGLAGKPFAPLNYRLADDDLRRLVARTAPSIAIVDDDMVKRVAGTAGVEVVSRSGFEKICTEMSGEEPPFCDPDIAVLLFTSGTTGEPKIAILRHRHLTSYVVGTVEFLGSDEDEAALVSMANYHVAGISAALTGVYGGRRIVYLPNFTPEAWVDAVASEKITHAMVVPTMLGRILDVMEKRGEKLPSLRALSYGAGHMPLPVIERAMKLLPHVDFVNAYGLTETSSTISILNPEDHRAASSSSDPKIHQRLGSVGRPVPGVELQIRDPDGHVLPAGEAGEVYVRGEQVAGEYKHRKVIQDDGWFPTNDSGWVDEDGYLFLKGRLDDVIVRGGENISPGEIEAVLREHPQVADVAVLGVPDVQWGERIAAVIVPKGGTPPIDELAKLVKTRLRSTKTPETWEFRKELPYNDTGKLLRRVLRAELSQAADQSRS